MQGSPDSTVISEIKLKIFHLSDNFLFCILKCKRYNLFYIIYVQSWKKPTCTLMKTGYPSRRVAACVLPKISMHLVGYMLHRWERKESLACVWAEHLNHFEAEASGVCVSLSVPVSVSDIEPLCDRSPVSCLQSPVCSLPALPSSPRMLSTSSVAAVWRGEL